MGNAITSLIAQSSGGSHNDQEECVLLSEEHSLVLTCCWVSLKVTHTLETLFKIQNIDLLLIVCCCFFLFFVSLGNWDIFRFSGRACFEPYPSHWLPSYQTRSNKSIKSFLEYSVKMPSLGELNKAKKEGSRLNTNFPKRKIIILHQGAVEGCCIGFTKFCASLLRSNDQELKEIPADMLKQVSSYEYHCLSYAF